MTEYCYQNEALRAKLAPKGKAVLSQEGAVTALIDAPDTSFGSALRLPRDNDDGVLEVGGLEAQRLARRETMINEVGAQLQRVSGIEDALTLTAQHLQTALGAPHVAIRLGQPPAAASGQEVDA